MRIDVIAVIGVGSNIQPEENVQKAEELLRQIVSFKRASTFKYTKPLLFEDQADFYNGAFLISTSLDQEDLVKELKVIEDKLGRVRTENKNAPRTIDLDVVVYNNVVVDEDVYKRDFLKNAVIELLPDLRI